MIDRLQGQAERIRVKCRTWGCRHGMQCSTAVAGSLEGQVNGSPVRKSAGLNGRRLAVPYVTILDLLRVFFFS